MKKIVNHKLYWVPEGHEKQYKNWIKKLNKSNIELDLLSYSAVKLTSKISDSP